MVCRVVRDRAKRTFVVGPRIVVGPTDELLVYPREQSDWGVRESVPRCLWLCALLDSVTPPLLAMRSRLLESSLRLFVETKDGVLAEEEKGVREGCWVWSAEARIPS